MLFIITHKTNRDFDLTLYMFDKVTFNHSEKTQNCVSGADPLCKFRGVEVSVTFAVKSQLAVRCLSQL